jgi:hypothetical protein
VHRVFFPCMINYCQHRWHTKRQSGLTMINTDEGHAMVYPVCVDKVLVIAPAETSLTTQIWDISPLKVSCLMLNDGNMKLLLYKVHHFKCNPTTITYYNTKTKSEAGPPLCNTLPNFPVTLESRSPWLLGRCSCQLHKNCAGTNMVFS